MDVTLANDEPDWTPEVDELVREQVRRVELLLIRERTPDAALLVSCRATAEGLTELHLELTGVGTPRVVDAVVDDLEQALPKAFDELLCAPDRPPGDRVVDVVARVFPDYVAFAEREVAIFELEERLPDDVELGDLVDEAVAEVLPALPDGTQPQDALRELKRAFLGRLRALGAKTDAIDRRDQRLPSPAGGLDDAEVGDEDPDAWFPSEDFALMEQLRDPDAYDPEVAVAERESREKLVRAMFRLGEGERRDWEEVAMGGWAVDALASAQGRPERELRRELDGSRRFLAQALGASEEQVDELYAALGQRYRDERKDV